MDDDRIWAFEKSLWTGDTRHYRELIDDECVMVLPTAPYVFTSKRAAETPRWSETRLSDRQVMRPQEGLIAIAYKAVAMRDGSDDYVAFCTTTMRRLEHDVWRVVPHQQMPLPSMPAGSAS